jgi:ribosomal protein L14E/L6E/L27E
MRFEKAQIVRSLSGHDSGDLFCVLDTDGAFLLLADGKRRRVSSPKRKNCKHVVPVGSWEHPTLEKVRAGQSVGDKELRAVLAQIRDNMEV